MQGADIPWCGGYFCGKRECVHFVGANQRDKLTKKQVRTRGEAFFISFLVSLGGVCDFPAVDCPQQGNRLV